MGEVGKTCTKCSESKPLSEFYKKATGKLGTMAYCISCDRKQKALTYKKNAERNRLVASEYRKNNPERVKTNNAKWCKAHPEYAKERYAKDPLRIRRSNKKWRANNPEYVREYNREWAEKNPERSREIHRNAVRKKRSTPKGKLEANIRSAVIRGLIRGGKNGKKTFDLLGYSLDELKTHLEKQFISGMTWGNYGKSGWEVDHIIPLAAHNYQTVDDIDFKRAWTLSNLQPLWGPENRQKNARLTKPFQPSFAMPLPANDNMRISERITA